MLGVRKRGLLENKLAIFYMSVMSGKGRSHLTSTDIDPSSANVTLRSCRGSAIICSDCVERWHLTCSRVTGIAGDEKEWRIRSLWRLAA